MEKTVDYLTEYERKKEHVWEGNKFRFWSSRFDLSTGVWVEPIDTYEDSPNVNDLASDIMLFTHYFMEHVLPKLNGFSGFDTIKWHVKSDSVTL